MEAGGVVTDINGKELDFSCGDTMKQNLGIVATCNLTIHNLVIENIKKILTPANKLWSILDNVFLVNVWNFL